MSQTVLIVDDSPSAAPELRAVLETEGFQVISALRGEEALDALDPSHVDAIVTEALLPGMDGFELVRRLRSTPSGRHIPIIMLTVRSDPKDYAAGFEAGADEYFLKPFDPVKLVAATRGLIARYQHSSNLSATAGQVTRAEMRRPQRGQIITVFSLKGGVGKTTIAVNLAVAIKQIAQSMHVGLVDLALEEGLDSLLLDIVATSTIADWAAEDPSNRTPQSLSQYFIQHRSGIALLAAPTAPEQAETVHPDAVRSTLTLARQVFDYLVVDTAPTFAEASLIALESADTVLLPITPEMGALKTAVNALRIFQAVGVGEEKIRVVVNEVIPRAGLSREQIETSLGREVFPIANGGAACVDAANQGVPLVTAMPTAPPARAIVGLAMSICPPETPDVARDPGTGLLGRLRPDFLTRQPRSS